MAYLLQIGQDKVVSACMGIEGGSDPVHEPQGQMPMLNAGFLREVSSMPSFVRITKDVAHV